MILPIVVYPNPKLKTLCEPVQGVTQELRTLVDNMFETMYRAPGVGLAAPQIGEFIRLIVMDTGVHEKTHEPRVLINPEITLTGESILSQAEGCLSVPLGYRADVMRSSSLHLKARDLDWNLIEEDLSGYPAIVVQHETDHLDGKLFIDRISRLKRMLFDSKVKKWLKQRKNTQ